MSKKNDKRKRQEKAWVRETAKREACIAKERAKQEAAALAGAPKRVSILRGSDAGKNVYLSGADTGTCYVSPTTGQEMLTPELLAVLPDGDGDEVLCGAEAVVYLKFFSPMYGWDWYITAFNPVTDLFYGFVEGLESEWGAITWDDLHRLGAERRTFPEWKPMKFKDITDLRNVA